MATATTAAAPARGQAPLQSNVVRLPVRVSRHRLTERLALSLPGPVHGTEKLHYDHLVPALAVRVLANGRRTWIVTSRTTSGRPIKLKIGDVGSVTPADARRAARVILGKVARGEDPAAERKAARAAHRAARTGAGEPGGITLRQAADGFLRAREAALRDSTWQQYRRLLDRHALPALGERLVGTIGREDVDQLHARVTERAGPACANRLRAVLSALFTWAKVEPNPARGSARHREADRERVLDRRELAALLATARSRQDSAGRLIVFLSLTAARKSEAIYATWADFDLDSDPPVWRKPAHRTKSGKAHVVPLSPAAVDLLREQDPAERVFPVSASGLQRAFRSCCAEAGIEGARVHDLRRSAATLMVTSGVPLPCISKLLGHAAGSAITARIYARSTSAAEAEAAAKLGAMLGA